MTLYIIIIIMVLWSKIESEAVRGHQLSIFVFLNGNWLLWGEGVLPSFTTLLNMAYLRLKSGVFHKTSICCSPSLAEAKKFTLIGGTFSRRPLTGRGWGFQS